MRGVRSGAAGLMVAAAALLLAACGGGSSPSSAPATTSTSTSGSSSGSTSATSSATGSSSITISNFMFEPMTLDVAPGATVKVTNDDSSTHTLTATGGQFDTGAIAQNQTKTFTAPTKPGQYHYICNIHQYMMGTIDVK